MAGLLGPNFQDLTLRNSRVPRRITSGVTGRWSQPTKNVFPIIRGLVKPLVHIIAGAALTGELMPVFDGLAPRRCPMLAKLSLIVAGDVAGHPLMRQRSRLLCSVCARTRACGDTGDNVMPGRFGAAPARRPGIGIFAPGSQPAPLLPRRNEGGITLRASWRRRS